VVNLVPSASSYHGLEEARGLGDLPAALLDLSFLDVDYDISVPFDTGKVLRVMTHRATSEHAV